MAFWKIVTLTCTATVIADALTLAHKREASTNLCDTVFNSTNKVQCYCVKDKNELKSIKSAECFLTVQNIPDDDPTWNTFKTLGAIERLTLSNTRGIPLLYVPTQALKETSNLIRLDIKYGTINTIGTFAFANSSSLEEITLRDNQIAVLDPYAFIHHKNLKIISLDTNNIAEINRNVFVDLPAIEKLYLTNNQISTIHDKAFKHLESLRELEIDRNKVFSLNFDVFEGLKNLEKLDLSTNNLEVIGDNTFHTLHNLKSLNLDGNKIQMLDGKAFNGLEKLISLSLAHNKLMHIDGNKVFEDLTSLVSLSFKGNQLKELKKTAIEPIMGNLYGASGNLDVDDNKFPCTCQLEWFVSLMNSTSNKHLKISLENLKCTPDDKLRDAWMKAGEMEKATTPKEEETQEPGDYEYYDDTQLNGTLFYVDVRDILNCSAEEAIVIVSSTVKTTTIIDIDPNTNNTITNEIGKADISRRENKEDRSHPGAYTTNRLSTVSAKPDEIHENMPSDEARPGKEELYPRRYKEESKVSSPNENSKTNRAGINVGCVMLLISSLILRLLV